MKSDRWRQIEKLYHSARELETKERVAFLDQACGGDEGLRDEIESLLAYESRAEQFIESPALEVAAAMLAKDQLCSEPGSSIGPYEVLSIIGAGGMGRVYLAQDSRLGRKVALKVLPKEHTQDTDRVRRFEQEARAASALNHPNIITIFEIGRAQDTHYIAYEYVEGETLRDEMKRSRIEVEKALDIGCQIAGALAAAHEAGIVHRDVKPENIMLRPDGYVKVLDFGIAKLTESYAPPADTQAQTAVALSTDTGIVLGTTRYMSPEQARGQKIDARTDLFALGVVIYEMIAEVPPFTGPTSVDVLAAILAKEPPPLTSLMPEAPEALDWIIARTLRKDRDERYQTAKELLGDIRGLKQRLDFEKELKRSMGGSGAGVGEAERSEAGSLRPSSQPHTIHSHKVIDSIAVLPLVNTSADPGMEYFSDGITESIINTLSELPELRVMAWSTVSRYKGRQVDPCEVGRDLGVRAVLTGRLLQMPERLVFKVELVNAADGSHLWGGSCSCEPSDILRVEEGICNDISERMLLRLTAQERERLTKRYTDNTEAYHAYLKGRHFWNKRTYEGVMHAIEYFKQAIDTDPSYALAYAGLADSYLILGSFGVAAWPSNEAIPKAREAASRALEIDDKLAEAHASLGYCLSIYYWDWADAEREFKRCFELKPGYATAHHWYGFIYLIAMGKVDEAIKEVRRAFELDPLSLPISANIGLLLSLAGRHDQAIDHLTKTLEMDQNFVYSHWQLGVVYVQKGMYEEAIAEFEKAIALSGGGMLPISLLGHAYAISGRRDEALAVADQLSEQSKQRYVSPYRVAVIYAGLGQREQAFAWLDRACEERDGWLVWLRLDPMIDPVRPDKRFKRLLRRIGLEGASKRQARKRASTKAITSLAILPLANNCDDPGMDYFSDGITESIINTLAGLPRIRVVARSSAFRYKGRQPDPREVGRELGVQAVVTGRVRQTENRLVVSAELIDVTSNSQLWGEQYNRKLSDIFEVQEEIAREITEKLRLKLSRKEKGRIGRRHTDNVEAYQAYLKGRFFWYKRTEEAMRKGIEYFNRAIELDPIYADAYCGLSDSYALLALRGLIPAREAFVKAKAAVRKALEIDDKLGEAYASLAHVRLHDWDWEGLEDEFKHALKLSPGHAMAHQWYAEYLRAMGRTDESVVIQKQGQEIDPLSPISHAALSIAFYFARNYDQAVEQARKGIEMEPGHFLLYLRLGQPYVQKGMYEEAVAQIEKAVALSERSPETLAGLAQAYGAAGLRDSMQSVLDELNEQSKSCYVSPYYVAKIYAALGEKDLAFDWLEKAYAERNPDFIELGVEPLLDGLRSDPRFEDLLERLGFGPGKP